VISRTTANCACSVGRIQPVMALVVEINGPQPHSLQASVRICSEQQTVAAV